MEIKVGSKLRDNDKRTDGRIVEVTRVDDTYAYYKTGPRSARVRLDRIFSDGLPRKTGFNLVVIERVLPAVA